MERKFVSKNGCKDFVPETFDYFELSNLEPGNVIEHHFGCICKLRTVCKMYDEEKCDMMASAFDLKK